MNFFRNKRIFILTFLLISIATLTGCSNIKTPEKPDNKISVITTIFPEYDWVMSLINEQNENFDVKLLLDGCTDLHSYQPTVQDISAIADCDLFIYVGGESDSWVNECLENIDSSRIKTVNLLEILGNKSKEEAIIEGMSERKILDIHTDNDQSDEEHEYDEHVWLSLKNAEIFCNAIKEALCQLDPDHAESFQSQYNNYMNKLNILDKLYESVVSTSSIKTLLFADRFPFRYLTDDYGLNYYAAFVGCSAESEASFETLLFLANKVDQERLPVILTLENSDQRIARTVRDTSAARTAKILPLNSLQSASTEDRKNGITYLSVMHQNLVTIYEALGNKLN